MRAKEARSASTNEKQEQDAIERRRLQNRLSQRNHRRKIRDRIAKLQERVIASELRAAATLNGWGYHHPTVPLSVAQAPPYDVERKALSPTEAIVPSMGGPYLPCSTGACYSCNTLPSAPILPSQHSPTFPPFETTGKEVDSSSVSSPSVLTNNSVCSPDTNSVNMDITQNTSSSYMPPDMNGQLQAEPWNLYAQYSSSSLYYIATDASLPHVMQMLENGYSRPKAVILLQPSPHPTGVSTPSTSQPPSPGEPGPATNSFNMTGLTCQCHTRSLLPDSPVEWMHAGTSPSICPLHSPAPLDDYQPRMS
ncbi:hypothetical protein BDV28DRAFT_89911 [Aspergillus coremiiformis]|uniref:BZIP domain-containing protein n=1 Tax=Aspergillus coremiiformis TaxID=138285 RepID=A0A5N6ZDQ0_9EURO|nr:hypothetical protein BDV28DRAFT_89911 [Aspergillus coremiiformis]